MDDRAIKNKGIWIQIQDFYLHAVCYIFDIS